MAYYWHDPIARRRGAPGARRMGGRIGVHWRSCRQSGPGAAKRLGRAAWHVRRRVAWSFRNDLYLWHEVIKRDRAFDAYAADLGAADTLIIV